MYREILSGAMFAFSLMNKSVFFTGFHLFTENAEVNKIDKVLIIVL